jgi:hypothetical protein
MPYPALFQLTAAGAASHQHSTRSGYLYDLDAETAEAIVEGARKMSSPTGMIQVRVLGGAMARAPENATVFAHRDKLALLVVANAWDDPAESPRHVAWTEAVWQSLKGKAAGSYANFLEDEGERRVYEAYPGATYRRLAEVKRAYDPTNLFRLNQNIRPAA